MESVQVSGKEYSQTYEAKRMRKMRAKKKLDDEDVNHTDIKTKHAEEILAPYSRLKTLELFQGKGGMTDVYLKHGKVVGFDKDHGDGDSFLKAHELIYKKRKYDVIDLDPYCFPNRMFPHIFLLIENGFLFVTTPNGHAVRNIPNENLNVLYWGKQRPMLDDFVEGIIRYGHCHKLKVEFISSIDLTNKMYRMAFKVEKLNTHKNKVRLL